MNCCRPISRRQSRLARSQLGALALVLICAAALGCAGAPPGKPGPDADALALAVETHVNKAAWDATGAVRFTFSGKRTFLWDKGRSFVQVTTGSRVAQLDLWDRTGTARDGEAVLSGDAEKKALEDVWAAFCNDTFWLNPLVKLFDDGVTRSSVVLDGDDAAAGLRGLLVSYASGGVTPGDSYLWLIDGDNVPRAVKMWVSVLPVKGLRFSWDGWQTLKSGARVATLHAAAAGPSLALSGVEGAATLAELAPGPDPFAALALRRAQATP